MDYLWYKLGWVYVAIVTPEIIMWCALSQWREARKIHKMWSKHYDPAKPEGSIPGKHDHRDWLGMPGAFFAVMGGFVIEYHPDAGGPYQHCVTSQPRNPASPRTPASKPAFSVQEGIIGRREHENVLVTTITTEGFLKMLEDGIFDRFIRSGKLTEGVFHQRLIQDKGKADSVAKTLICLQILWMVAQVIGRKISGLPVTLLEIHVLIQVIFTTVIHLFWWNKPLDVSEPIVLPADCLGQLRYTNYEQTPADTESEHSPLDRKLFTHDITTESTNFPGSGYPEFVTEKRQSAGFFQMFWRSWYDLAVHLGFEGWGAGVSTFLALLNGGLHAFAWNSHFPTPVERLLWRICCPATSVIILLVFMLTFHNGCEWHFFDGLYSTRFQQKMYDIIIKNTRNAVDDTDRHKGLYKLFRWRWTRFILGYATFFLGTSYVSAMLYITVESVISVRSLPAGSYSTLRWADLWPHL
jgi:hypothetical protein